MAESTCSRPHNRLIFAAGIHSIFGIYSDIQSVAMNYLHVPLKPFLNQSFYAHYGIALNKEDFLWVWGMTASCNYLGMLLSALIVRTLMDNLGRKNSAMILRPIIGLLAAILMMIALPLQSFECFAVGFALAGAGSTLKGVLIIYLAECSPDKIRGIITLAAGTSIQLIANIIAMTISLPKFCGNDKLWPILPFISALFAVLHLLSSYFLPPSPKHLHITKRETEEARRAIRFYHGDHVDVAVFTMRSQTSKPVNIISIALVILLVYWLAESLISHIAQDKILSEYDREHSLVASRIRLSIMEIFRSAHLRTPLLICIVASLVPQLSASSIRGQYSRSMLKSFGVPDDTVMFVIMGINLAPTPFCLLAPWLIERFGRRPLFIACILLSVLQVGFLLVTQFIIDYIGASTVTVALGPTAFLCGSFASVLGVVTIACILVSELCPHATRSTANQAISILPIILSLITVFLYKPALSKIGGFVFVPLLVAELLVLVTIYLLLPETKNLSVGAIVENMMDNDERELLLADDRSRGSSISINEDTFVTSYGSC